MEKLIIEATSETNTADDWGKIIEICEKADQSEASAREALTILSKRILHKNVNVILFSLTVANSLVQNCDMTVKREVSSRAFLDALVRQITTNKASVHVTVHHRILELIQQWADVFRSEPSLDYMVQIYNQLKSNGHSFPTLNPKPVVEKRSSDKDREEDELQLALALSLSTVDDKSRAQNSQPKSGQKSKPVQSLFQVTALYDFYGTEEGELHLSRGDVVEVYDCTTFQDWWKGSLRGVVGIFPANYVEKVTSESGATSREHAPPSSGGTTSSVRSPDAYVLSQSGFVSEFRDRVLAADARSTNYAATDQLQNDYHKLLELRPHVISIASNYRKKQDDLTAISERFVKADASFRALIDAQAQYHSQAAAAYSVGGGSNPYTQPPIQQYQQHQQQQPQHQQPQHQVHGQPPAGYAPTGPIYSYGNAAVGSGHPQYPTQTGPPQY
ncbi:hypothetical protein BASA60_005573 [Batrachochytrium salamandrivorans]|nr:hypothetical protein BASA60_005573 [Batrachochytrium salamandrivorans]KAH9248424.1 hypothetical protein BASA81_013918 [Batrachochytrium salamandrivorans]